MRFVVWLVTFARGLVLVAYGVALVLLAYHIRAGDGVKTAAPLQANHLLGSVDLKTSATDELVNHYMRVDIEGGQTITPGMVSEHPVVPVIPAGIVLVVNIEKAQAKLRDLKVQQEVEIQKNGQTLQKGTITALPCDESRCAVLISTVKTTGLEATSLVGADVVPAAPAPSTPPIP
jgi:hypothetical protein